MSYLEQRAMEESDALVSPSNYLVNWMRLQGWNLPEATDVIPYYLYSQNLLGVSPSL